MSSMQPNQPESGQQLNGSQLFPPYQAPDGQPQPYMAPPDPSLPQPQNPNYQQPMVMKGSAGGNQGRPTLLIVSLVVSVVFALSMGLLSVWVYGQMQDYKNNSDKKSAAAAEAATKVESDRKDKEFVDKEKQPYKTYKSSDETGAVKITYPKTWSGYVATDNSTNPVDGYWHPDVVPGLQSKTAYALRLEVSSQSYADEMKTFDSQVKGGKVKVSPYVPKNVTGVTGARVEGEIDQDKKTVMIVLPLRDKSIKIYTESPDFVSDFDNIVLANLTFTP